MQTRMAVAIVNWNTRDLLRGCLQSVLADAPGEVVVVDNGSSDGSPEMVRGEFPGVALHELSHNPGYGAGCNLAVRATHAEYVLLLNSDTELAPGSIAALTGALDARPRAAIVGPTILNLDGSIYRSCFPFPSPGARLFVHEPFAGLAELLPATRARLIGRWRPDQARAVPWVLGAALAVRRRAFEEVGGFDERFEMYCEEVDLSRRLLARGWETHYVPVTRVVHVGGASTVQRRSAMRARLELSLIRLYRRHHRGMTRRIALGALWAKAGARFIRDSCRHAVSHDARQRADLAEDLAGWRSVLAAARRSDGAEPPPKPGVPDEQHRG